MKISLRGCYLILGLLFFIPLWFFLMFFLLGAEDEGGFNLFSGQVLFIIALIFVSAFQCFAYLLFASEFLKSNKISNTSLFITISAMVANIISGFKISPFARLIWVQDIFYILFFGLFLIFLPGFIVALKEKFFTNKLIN